MSLQQNANPLKLSILVCVRNKGINIKVMLKILHAMIEVPHEILFIHDNPDDDCDQIPATQRYKGDWSKSALSKIFFKDGTPVVDELDSRGMLIKK